MKLSKAHIQFIDTYLQNSGIAYLDIRMELVDHIANAIENDLDKAPELTFYDAFKSYMIVNKAPLLRQNKNIIKRTDSMLIQQVLKQLFTFGSAIVFLITYVLLSGIAPLLGEYIPFLPIFVLLIFAICYTTTTRFRLKYRLSATERLGFWFGLSFQVVYLVLNPLLSVKSIYSYVLVAISLCFTLVFVLLKVHYFNINTYKRHLKSVI